MPWQPTSAVAEEWGWIQICVGGKQVNTFRGAPTLVQEYQLEEPYGYGPATLRFPAVTEFDALGAGELSWLAPGRGVELHHVNPAGTRAKTLWAGFMLQLDVEADEGTGGLTAYCVGALSGRLGVRAHHPHLTQGERDVFQGITRDIRGPWGSPGLSFPFWAYHATGNTITTRKRGARSQTALDFADEMLAYAQTETDQWTIRRVPGTVRNFEPALKDRTTLHATVHAGGRGVSLRLRHDPSLAPNVMYGEGVAIDGCRWSGTVYPDLFPEQTPPYPYTDTGRAVALGDTDDTVDVFGSISIWHIELAYNGRYPWGRPDTHPFGTWNANSVKTLRKLQRDMGVAVTGVLDSTTWPLAWTPGVNGSDLSGARYDPLAYGHPNLRQHFLSKNGSFLAKNENYDRSILRVDGFTSYGEGVDKDEAERDAEIVTARNMDPGWFGTLTLRADPEQMHRLDLREGMNVRLRRFGAGAAGTGPLLHVAGIRVRPEDDGCPVELTVDTEARDLLTVTQIIQRAQEAKQDPAKNILNQRRRSAISADSFIGWDCEAGAGQIPLRKVQGGQWTIIKVVGAQFGRLIGIDLQTVNSNNQNVTRRYCVAVFGDPVTAPWLDSRIPAPLTARADNYAPFDVPAIQDDLEAKQFLEAWGGPNQAAGYWPGYEQNENGATAHPVTGRLVDSASAEFASRQAPWLFMGVWIAGADCYLRGRLFAASEE